MGRRVWVNRGHEPRADEAYGYVEIVDIGELPAVVGLGADTAAAV